jgi:hypothetical protein
MRFVLVNGRTPCRQSFCARCREPIGAGYLREIGTQLCYCDHDCFADHGDDQARSNGFASATGAKWLAAGGLLPNAGPVLLRPKAGASAGPLA